MSSTNKTNNIGLNSWIGSDIPQMADFNRDNSLIDEAISSHSGNTAVHASASEKEIWNSPYTVYSYSGNGQSTRTLSTGLSYEPSWGIVFATAKPPSIVDVENEANYNYFGIFTKSGATTGISISGTQLEVMQSSSPIANTEYRNYNENGVTYVCILFR